MNCITDQRVNSVTVRTAKYVRYALGDILIAQDSCPNCIVDIVIHIGDLVTSAYNLPLQCLGNICPGMSKNSHANLICQIQPSAVMLQNVHDPQTLLIVMERDTQTFAQCGLPRVAEWRVSQIMPHCNCLSQILIQAKCPRYCSGNSADLQRVGHPGPIVVSLRTQENLSFVHQPPKGLTVHNSVDISLIACADVVFPRCLRHRSAGAFIRKSRQRVQSPTLLMLNFFPDCHGILPFPK